MIYSALLAKNHQKFRSGFLVHEFSFTDIFNNINHGCRAAILKKNSLWLLPFFMAVATYCYYEKIHRTMCNAIVSNLKCCLRQSRVKNFLYPTMIAFAVIFVGNTHESFLKSWIEPWYTIYYFKEFTFYRQIPKIFWYSFDQRWKGKRLSWPWGHPIVLKLWPLD